MKFGQSLHQRSIPEWSTHNIDYNDLKRLIKLRTTRVQGQAQAIPGTTAETHASQQFEDELLAELADQHDRVELFVRSKFGEVSRKLAHLEKQIAALEKQAFSQGQKKISVRQLELFSRLEDQTLKAGQEVQSLSQFVNANRLALRKLLKKYKKWTRSARLGERMHAEVIDHASDFSGRSFEPLLATYVHTLAAVRRPFDTGAHWHAPSLRDHKGTPASLDEQAGSHKTRHRMQSANTGHDHGKIQPLESDGGHLSPELDAILGATPLSERAESIAFWIHPEHVVELQILLLQHTRIRHQETTSSCKKGSARPQPTRYSSTDSRHDRDGSSDGHRSGYILCDDLQRRIERQEKASDANRPVATPAETGAIRIYYSLSSAVFMIHADSIQGQKPCGSPQQSPRQAIKLRRKAIPLLFERSEATKHTHNNIETARRAYGRLTERTKVRPLIQVEYKRSHFVGVGNIEKSGTWVTLDTDVRMRKYSSDTSQHRDENYVKSEENSRWEGFPHAILEVMVENNDDSRLLTILDDSHLTTRIPGFSMEAHAIATLYKSEGVAAPSWLLRLNEDLRNVPRPKSTTRQRSHQNSSPNVPSPQRTSTSNLSTRAEGKTGSGFSTMQGESSATSVPDVTSTLDDARSKAIKKRKRRRPIKKRRLPPKEVTSPQYDQRRRGWNEFDDGSEGEGDEPYTIFIDPNAPSMFPGAELVTRLANKLSTSVKTGWKRISTLGQSPETGRSHTRGERSPLLGATPSPTVDESSDSDEDKHTAHQRSYNTVPKHYQLRPRAARESLLFHCCLGWLSASCILLIVAAILLGTGRRKAATEVDAGVVMGVTASMVFAILGVGCMAARHDLLGRVHRTVVISTFVVELLANSLILAYLSWV